MSGHFLNAFEFRAREQGESAAGVPQAVQGDPFRVDADSLQAVLCRAGNAPGCQPCPPVALAPGHKQRGFRDRALPRPEVIIDRRMNACREFNKLLLAAPAFAVNEKDASFLPCLVHAVPDVPHVRPDDFDCPQGRSDGEFQKGKVPLAFKGCAVNRIQQGFDLLRGQAILASFLPPINADALDAFCDVRAKPHGFRPCEKEPD